ncbi:hypothetical protein FOCG_08449 [Fusarium oxysporum f. sp. radicis-lycopersici 26381]|nr:hypothetical protein FOCG_08449 [Fusarium oxysporum f. sp. radicis-lycopersici 26381]
MSSKLYVGEIFPNRNLAGSTTDESLREIFGDYGQVLDSITVNMVNARATGGSGGGGGGYGGSQGGYGGGYQQGGYGGGH